jgi:RNA polymerase sigma-70 factor (ECF subfamily)
MNQQQSLAEQFEFHRAHLRNVAYRLLGSRADADDAVQEAWLRLSRSEADEIANLGAWLTTATARISLDMLRSRKVHSSEPLDADGPESEASLQDSSDPERDRLFADSVGVALLVVLEKLAPAERLAFVLHDVFAMPFEEIAPIVDRSPTATRQLASRARRRIQGNPEASESILRNHRSIVDAFLAAARHGDFEALLVVLDPDVVLRADHAIVAREAPIEVRGAPAVARGALSFSERTQFAQLALVDGELGIIVAPDGRLLTVLRFGISRNKIARIDVIADPARLGSLKLTIPVSLSSSSDA